MEIITTIASAISSELQTTALVTAIVSGFIGNQADKIICNSSKNFHERIKNNHNEPSNHDIQKAVRRAFLNATLTATKNVDAYYGLEEITKYIKKELLILKKENTRFPENEMDDKFEQLLNPKGLTIEQRMPEIKLILKESLFKELLREGLIIPINFKNKILNGWKDNGREIDWYELICAFASEEFKTNERIRSIIYIDYLSILNEKSNNIDLKIEDILATLEGLNQSYIPFIEKLDNILKIGERTEKKIDSIEYQVKKILEKNIPPKVIKSKNLGKQNIYNKLSKKVFLNLEFDDIIKYIQELKSLIPPDDISYYWLGILYLKQKNHKQSIHYLKAAIEINIMSDEYHYNLALAMFEGKRPFRLKLNEIQDILSELNKAINIERKKRKYYYLKYIIIQDFFIRCGLVNKWEGSVETLLKMIIELPKNSTEENFLLSTLGLTESCFPISSIK